MTTCLIQDCQLYDAPEASRPTSVLTENGLITAIGAAAGQTADTAISARGLLLAPGYIDVHIQGAGGADILDATEEALVAIAQTCARFGTTSYLATTVFKPGQDNAHLPLAADYVGKDLKGATLLGIHLEGPFISQGKRGMIQPDCLSAAESQVLSTIYDLCQGHLRMMTIAPELDGALDLIRSLKDHDVIASQGHTEASYEQSLAGFQAGICHVTHLFNAMTSLHHRAPGPWPAQSETPEITAQIIPDGVHVHPAVLRQAWALLDPKRVIAITDGMQALGLPDGFHVYNGINYESKDGAARYADGTLIGTSVGLSELVRRLKTFTGCSLRDAIVTATENPARLLNLHHRKGAIRTGFDADLVLLNPNLSVHTTLVGGKVVYQA